MKTDVFLQIMLKQQQEAFMCRFGNTESTAAFLQQVGAFAFDAENAESPSHPSAPKFFDALASDDEIKAMLSEDESAPVLFQIVTLSLLLSPNAKTAGMQEDAKNLTDLALIDYNRVELLAQIRANLEAIVAYFTLLKMLGVEPDCEGGGRGFGDFFDGAFKPSKFQATQEYVAYMKKHPELQALAKVIGHHADKKNSARGKNASVAYDGIYYSDDVQTMVSSELLLHHNPRTRTEFYRRYAQKQLQCFKHTPDDSGSGKKQQKGPVIVCLDTSGSMSGSPEKIAKALTLALVQVAASENRALFIISFSVQFESICIKNPSAMGELLRIESFLEMSFNGGTDIGPACERACEVLDEDAFTNADILMISDFLTPPLSASARDRIEIAKQTGTLFYALEVGTSGDAGVLSLMDSHWRYARGLEKVR